MQDRERRHRRKMTEMEYAVLASRSRVANLREGQRAAAALSVNEHLKRVVFERHAAAEAAERRAWASRREGYAAKLPGTWKVSYPTAYVVAPQIQFS